MEESKALIVPEGAYLAHHGVKGMRWGVVNEKPSKSAGKVRTVTTIETDDHATARRIHLNAPNVLYKQTMSRTDFAARKLGIREKAMADRAFRQYRENWEFVKDRSGEEVIVHDHDEFYNVDGHGMVSSTYLVLDNPGITEHELIERMVQSRQALLTAQKAYAKTPSGRLDTVIKKGRALAKRALRKLSELFD